MGLAASQARLLTITARKADCEFLSMSLSHQKLSLSRDMENVSSEYQKALNQTKLVYDYYGSGDKSMALSYGLLMTPSIYNDYYPKLVTDPTNRVILNGAYAAAARAAGIPVEGLLGTPSSDVRNKFIEALVGSHVISASQAASIEAIPYGNTIGLGDTINATASITEVSFDEFMDLLDAKTLDSLASGLQLSGRTTYSINREWEINGNSQDEGTRINIYNADGSKNAEYDNHNNAATIRLRDLLDGENQYVLSKESIWGERTPVVATASLQMLLTSDNGSFLSWMLESFSSILGGINSNDTALMYAANAVYDLLCPTDDLQKAANNMYENTFDDSAHHRKRYTHPGDSSGVENLTYQNVMDETGTKKPGRIGKYYDGSGESYTKNLIGFYYNGDRDHSGAAKKQTSETWINLNNIAKVFLTAYVQYMEGMENSQYNWEIGNIDNSNLFNPDLDDFKFTIVNDVELDDDNSQLYANFYDAMFNSICLHGWTENDRIDDNEYMGEMLKNGMGYISSISDDGFYYQGNYSTDKCILEVTDDGAIARAEAKYNTEKAKIEHKEDTIDLKMKNLDTEISSLTTEYDTTKQVITKAIEKSFKRYEA